MSSSANLDDIGQLDAKIQQLQQIQARLHHNLEDTQARIKHRQAALAALDIRKTRKQLEHELQAARSSLKSQQAQLKRLHKAATKMGSAGLTQLQALDKESQSKGKAIQQLTEQVKALEGRRKKQEKAVKERQRNVEFTNDPSKIVRAAQQLRHFQGLLKAAEQNFTKKKELLEQKQQQLKSLQQQLQQECARHSVHQPEMTPPTPTNERQRCRSIVHATPARHQKAEEGSLRKKEVLEKSILEAKRKSKQDLEDLRRRLEMTRLAKEQLAGRIQQKDLQIQRQRKEQGKAGRG